MTDIIRDIDEEMRRDAFLARVRRYSWVFFLVVIVVLVVVTVGYFWQDRQARAKAAAAGELSSALTLAETDAQGAKDQLDALAADVSNGNSLGWVVLDLRTAKLNGARRDDTEGRQRA